MDDHDIGEVLGRRGPSVGETPSSPSTPSDALDEGIAHFQQAALEAVRAARALLDAAEAVIREPSAIEAVVDTVSAFARTAAEGMAGRAGARSTTAPTEGASTDPDEEAGGFERIEVD